MNALDLHRQAVSAQAAYATGLNQGMLDAYLDDLLTQFADFTETQATTFSAEFAVVLQYNDTLADGGQDTGLSLTVFREKSTNALTLAIRGTSISDARDLATNSDILAAGVGFDQIVAMFNWWQRASTGAGLVPQYFFSRTNELYPDALPVQGGYLARTHDASATGELVTALAAAGGKVDVTGHSLGGHLAMAFQALFGAQTGAVTVFNAPGLLVNGENTAFFKALGGPSSGVPADDVPGLFNVVADHTSAADVPFQGIAMLHSRPGLAVDVPIEDQRIAQELLDTPAALNHSQIVLTDALAVQARLERLQPGLTHAQMSSLLAQVATQEHAGLERVVDALQALLGIDTLPLPTGHDQREAMHLACPFGRVVCNPPGESGGRDVVTVTADINAVAGDGGNWIDVRAGDESLVLQPLGSTCTSDRLASAGNDSLWKQRA